MGRCGDRGQLSKTDYLRFDMFGFGADDLKVTFSKSLCLAVWLVRFVRIDPGWKFLAPRN